MPWSPRECTCSYCLSSFATKLPGPLPTYCSGACRQAAYRERHGIGGREQPHRRTTDARREVVRRRRRNP